MILASLVFVASTVTSLPSCPNVVGQVAREKTQDGWQLIGDNGGEGGIFIAGYIKGKDGFRDMYVPESMIIKQPLPAGVKLVGQCQVSGNVMNHIQEAVSMAPEQGA
jgi:hypothetical protein